MNINKLYLGFAMFIAILSFICYRVNDVYSKPVNKITHYKKCHKKHFCKKLKIQPVGKIKVIKKYVPITPIAPEEQQQRYTIPQGETVTILDYKD